MSNVQRPRSNILLASNNPHKLGEFRGILDPHGIHIVALSDLDLNLDVAEVGTTFRQNALIKAEAFHDASGLVALADDSGLVVDALGGDPGIYSARFGGEGLSDADRMHLVLEPMEGVPWEQRTARFVAALAVAPRSHPTRIFEASVEGFITTEPRGRGGFGYDPIFFYPPLGRTFAELSQKQKSSVSHRGKALQLAAAFLKSIEL